MSLTSEQAQQSKFNQPNIQYCKFCNKQCKNLNSLKQHECRCPQNPNRKDYDHLSRYIIKNRKGKTKENCKDIQKQVNTMQNKYKNGYVNPKKGQVGNWLGKHHTTESKRKISKSVSISRLRGYADGSITPAVGVGRGKYSYIIYNGTKYLLRSTYEFIYALYLGSLGITFEVESIRVPAAISNPYARTFISDFYIPQNNLVVEIKGIPSAKDFYIRKSFENAGYNFKEYFKKDIDRFKKVLSKKYDVANLLRQVKLGHNSKQYFIYTIK